MGQIMSQEALNSFVVPCKKCGCWEPESKMFVKEWGDWPDFTLYLCKKCALDFSQEIKKWGAEKQ